MEINKKLFVSLELHKWYFAIFLINFNPISTLMMGIAVFFQRLEEIMRRTRRSDAADTVSSQ